MNEMTIDIPNGADILQLKLMEVLYSPEVGYTLVSVGHLDEKGFEVTFLGGKCTICVPDGNHIGDIPKLKGLYHVIHDQPEYVNSAEEELTLDQFHHRMGHEGKWMGIDKQSKGVRVYWLDKLTVGIKQNVYYDKMIASVSCLEGEDDTVIETRTDLPPANILSSSTSVPLENPVPTPHHAPTPPPILAPDPPVKKHVCKPSQCVLDIVEG